MEWINHYSIMTSHNRKSYPDEVSKEVVLYFKKLIKETRTKELVDLLDGVKMELTIEENMYMATLYIYDKENPILITAGCKNEKDRKYLWELLSESEEKIYGKSNIIKSVPPLTPYIVDMVLPKSIINMDVLGWTGDFTRCLGWIILSPESII